MTVAAIGRLLLVEDNQHARTDPSAGEGERLARRMRCLPDETQPARSIVERDQQALRQTIIAKFLRVFLED